MGVWLLARSIGMPRVAAVASGIIFAYSGFLTAHAGHYTIVAVITWLPFLLLALHRLVLGRSWWWAFGAGSFIFLMTTAGHQPTLLQSLTVAGIWWLFWLAWREQWFGSIRVAVAARDHRGALSETRYLAPDVLRAGLALGFGLLLVAPVVIPSIQLARLSIRSGISYEEATAFSAEPIVLIQFLLPKVFGSNPTDYWGPFANGEVWAYVGVATLVLAAIAVAVRRDPVRIFLAGMALVALIYAIGPFAPLHGWVWRFVPLYDLIRAPARAFVFVDLALALLAGFGIQEVSAARDIRSARLHNVLWTTNRVLLIGVASLVLFVLPMFYGFILRANDVTNRPVIAIDNIVLLTLYLCLTALLLWAVRGRHLAGALVGLAAVFLIVVDLFGATATFNPSPDDVTAEFRHPEITAYLRDEWVATGPFRLESATARWQPNLAAIIGVDDIGGLFDPMQLRNYSGVRDVAIANRSLPLYDALNARFLITDDQAANPGSKFTQVLRAEDGLILWENREAMPRAWLVGTAETIDGVTALAEIRRPDFDPRSMVYLSDVKAVPASSGAPNGSAGVSTAGTDRVQIRVETDRPSYLVIAQTSYPGWRATVDGRPTRLMTANGVFQAIAVPSGEHAVTLRFAPTHLALSVGASGAGVVLGSVMLALGLRDRRRSVRPMVRGRSASAEPK